MENDGLTTETDTKKDDTQNKKYTARKQLKEYALNPEFDKSKFSLKEYLNIKRKNDQAIDNIMSQADLDEASAQSLNEFLEEKNIQKDMQNKDEKNNDINKNNEVKEISDKKEENGNSKNDVIKKEEKKSEEKMIIEEKNIKEDNLINEKEDNKNNKNEINKDNNLNINKDTENNKNENKEDDKSKNNIEIEKEDIKQDKEKK